MNIKNRTYYFKMQNYPKLCLNMIVKNESRIILRLLESVSPIIDSYCICDTGSTDNTIEQIEYYFQEKGIPGKIIREPFRDFGYSRTFALKQCRNLPNADYILLMDADMVLRINPKISPLKLKQGLIDHAYFVFQGTERFFYKNLRIVQNNQDIEYWGVTHEYVKCPDHFIQQVFDRGDIFILDIGDGGSKADKYSRDIALLKKGLEDKPNNDRYTFYLANSYRDNGEFDNAIEYYKKRIHIGGWFEEVWHSYYSIGDCYSRKGDMIHAVYFWMEAFNFFPNRIENLYEIITYYRQNQKYNLAYQFYVIAANERKKIKVLDYLFLKKDIYDYKLDYEFTIIGYYTKVNNSLMTKTCMKVIHYPYLEENLYKNVISNYKFYTSALTTSKTDFLEKNQELLQNVGKVLLAADLDFFNSSTPSICMNDQHELVINMRYVNYKIKDDGSYQNRGTISTKNVVAVIDISKPVWIKKEEYLLNYNKSYDCLYEGLEDVRLFWHDKQLWFNANRGLGYRNMVIEHGIIQNQSTSSRLLKIENQNEIEKNWVIFQDAKKTKKMVYNWKPLIIGEVKPDSNVFQIEKQTDTPYFFSHLRGSSNGVNIGNEIWFLCHLVSYEDRRYYYHLFVIIDSTTFELKKYTTLFTFTKEKVEYSLGFIYQETGEFFIGYSVLDCSTHFMKVPKRVLDEMMICV